MITVLIASVFAFGDLDKTTASNLFDNDTLLSTPFASGKFSTPPKSVKKDIITTEGKIFEELRLVLSHYFSYFHANLPEFRTWYASDFYEIDDDSKKKMINSLNANITSIRDLDSFWLNTQGSYLKAHLARISSLIIHLSTLLEMQNLKYNTVVNEPDISTLTPEQRNVWILNKARYITENLQTGLANHENGRYTNVFKNFLNAIVEKKKLDLVFSKINLSL
jgi:hypothetical protein